MGRDLCELRVYHAVGNFSMGVSSAPEVLKKVKIDPGRYKTAGCDKFDLARLYNSEYKAKDSSTVARKKLRTKRKGHSDKPIEKERHIVQATFSV